MTISFTQMEKSSFPRFMTRMCNSLFNTGITVWKTLSLAVVCRLQFWCNTHLVFCLYSGLFWIGGRVGWKVNHTNVCMICGYTSVIM